MTTTSASVPEDPPDIAELSDRIAELERTTKRIADELEIRRLLAWFGFYADHDLNSEWAGLFTPDATFDVMMYHGENISEMDASRFRRTVYRGRDEMVREVLLSPAHQAVLGRSQHHVDGQPTVVDFESDTGATATTYGVLYIASDSPGRAVEHLNLSVNRWHFVKDGRWYIDSCVRRRLGAETEPLLPEIRR